MKKGLGLFGILVILALAIVAWSGRWPRSSTSERKPNSPSTQQNSTAESLSSSSEPKPEPSLKAKYCRNPYGTTCSTPWPSYDPTGKVQPDVTAEVLALRHLRDLIRKNPSWTSSQIEEELALKLYTPKRRAYIEDAFNWVTKNMALYIEQKSNGSFSPEERESLVRRISEIELEIPPPAQVYSDAPELLTKNTIYYERTADGRLRLRIGGAYLLNATSWYNLVFTFAHEVAHAIDPCETKHAHITPRAYEALVSCFVKVGWVQSDRAHCGQGEQISEVFADWMASEIAARAIKARGSQYTETEKVKAAINLSRDLCEQSTSPDSLSMMSHQNPRTRIESILGRNPSLRESLECGNESRRRRYCRITQVARGSHE